MNELAKIDGSAAVTRATAPDFPELVTRFLSAQDIRDASKRTYGRALKQFGRWIEATPRGQITRETVLNFKNDLNGRGLSSFTVSCYLTAVKRFFTWTEGAGLYPNIAKDIKLMKREQEFQKEAFTPTQARDILAAVKTKTLQGKRDFAIINLMIRTGLRTVEVIRANVWDISNRDDMTILFIQGKGRDGKRQFVVLTPATLAPINSYLKARGAVESDAPLFAAISNRNHGGRLTTRSVSRLTKSAIEKIAPGRDRLTAHSCRHSAVTFALKGGATVQEAQVFARHADINTTLIYSHNIDRLGSAPEIKIDAVLTVKGGKIYG